MHFLHPSNITYRNYLHIAHGHLLPNLCSLNINDHRVVPLEESIVEKMSTNDVRANGNVRFILIGYFTSVTVLQAAGERKRERNSISYPYL